MAGGFQVPGMYNTIILRTVSKILSPSADIPRSGGVVDNAEGGRVGRLLPEQPLLHRAQERGPAFPLGH